MKKFFTVALALIASVMLFTACAPGETQTPQASATPTPTPTVAPTPTPRETATLSDFVIIYPQSETMVAHPLKYKADDLNMALLGSVSTMCLPLSDLIDETQGFVENKYEILLGDTNRKESDDVIAQADNLRKYDYVIKAVGTKIVIYAATDEGYDLAFQDFARMCKENGFTAENALPAIKQIDVDHFHGNSPDGFFIDGVSIEEFVLVTSLTDKENKALLEKILDTTGYEIPLGDVNTPQEHEIIIGNVNRPEAIQACDEIRYMDISVRVINGKLVIGVGSKDAQADAVKYFTDEILDTKVDKKEYSSATDKVIPYGSYAMSEIKLFGKDISEYVIVADTLDDTAANVIKEYIIKLTGQKIKITTDASAENAIILGNAGTDEFKQLTQGLTTSQYVIKSQGSRIYLGTINPYYQDGPAVHKFFENYFAFDPKTEAVTADKINITESFDVCEVIDDYLMKEADKEFLDSIENKATSLKNKILNSATEVEYTGTAYYVANDGNDDNDGLTPETPWATLERVSNAALKKGDVVFFNRGDIFRGGLTTQEGVTYSAYGEGVKPRIFGSPYDGVVHGSWLKVAPNVYRYSEYFGDRDIGAIVFNHGEAVATKICPIYKKDGPINDWTNEPFSSRTISTDLHFFHDSISDEYTYNLLDTEFGYVYLCSTQGNPADRFDSIEFNVSGNIIGGENYVTLDNLWVQYGGSHGIDAGKSHFTVQNCEVSYVGGSFQGSDGGIRYGNGIELWGSGDNFTVRDCYVHHCFDTGITQQGSNCVYKNIHYYGNLLEYTNANIEYFNYADENNASYYMEGFKIHDNIMRYAGYSWGMYRPGGGVAFHITGLGSCRLVGDDNGIYNNIFQYSDRWLVRTLAAREEWLMPYYDNVFIEYEGGIVGSAANTTGDKHGVWSDFNYSGIDSWEYRKNEFYVVYKD